MYVCICHAVTDTDVQRSFDLGNRCADSIADHTGASTGCGSCRETLCDKVSALESNLLSSRS